MSVGQRHQRANARIALVATWLAAWSAVLRQQLIDGRIALERLCVPSLAPLLDERRVDLDAYGYALVWLVEGRNAQFVLLPQSPGVDHRDCGVVPQLVERCGQWLLLEAFTDAAVGLAIRLAEPSIVVPIDILYVADIDIQ